MTRRVNVCEDLNALKKLLPDKDSYVTYVATLTPRWRVP